MLLQKEQIINSSSRQEIAKHINYLKSLKQTDAVVKLLDHYQKRFKISRFESKSVFNERGIKEQKLINSIMKDLLPPDFFVNNPKLKHIKKMHNL